MDLSNKKHFVWWMLFNFAWGALSVVLFVRIGCATHFFRPIPKDKIEAVRHVVES